MYRTHKQPLGHATRGKTAAQRLRRLDRWIRAHHEGLLRRQGDWRDAAFVDLGYGANPTTTLEAARCFRRVAPDLLVVGLEIDPVRVEAAQYAVDERTRFRRGGFDLPLLPDESVRVLRAMNVLRQYPEDAGAAAFEAMRAAVRPGGLLVEGTSSPSGHRMAVNLVDAEHRVLFAANLRHPVLDPWEFTAILPKNLIHRVLPGEPVHGLLTAWRQAWSATQPAATFGPLAHWNAAGRYLWEQRSDLERRRSWLRRGYLVWRPPQ